MTASTSVTAVVPKSLFTVTLNNQSTTAANQNFTFVDRATTVLNNVYVQKIGIYSATARTMKIKVCKRNSAGNYDIVYDQSVSHGGTGFEDFALTTMYLVPSSGTYCIGVYCSSGGANPDTTASVARGFVGGDATGTGVTMTEDSAQTFPSRYTYTY